MSRDNSNIEHTCPEIDDVIMFLQDLDFDGLVISDMIDKMDIIRVANSALRFWANEENNRADENEAALLDLRLKYANLEKSIINIYSKL